MADEHRGKDHIEPARPDVPSAPTRSLPRDEGSHQVREAAHIESLACPGCLAAIALDARVCPHCGLPIGWGGPVIAGSETAAEGLNQRPAVARPIWKLIDNPWAILGLLFLALGPLAFPFLWRSRAFALWSKIVLSILTLAFTYVLLILLHQQWIKLTAQLHELWRALAH